MKIVPLLLLFFACQKPPINDVVNNEATTAITNLMVAELYLNQACGSGLVDSNCARAKKYLNDGCQRVYEMQVAAVGSAAKNLCGGLTQ